MERDLEVTIPSGDAFERCLLRYERLRTSLNLPLLAVTRTADRAHLVFSSAPPRLNVETASLPLAERALGWLARMERAWGEPLGSSVSIDELSYDSSRRVFAVGPGLFSSQADEPLLSIMGARLCSAEQGDRPCQGFEELAVRIAAHDPQTWQRIDPDLSDEERIRKLRQLAIRAADEGDPNQALSLSSTAWRHRPGDLTIASEILHYAIKAGAPARAEHVIDIVVNGAERSANLCVLLARYYQRTAHPERARDWAHQAAALGPDDPRSWEAVAGACHALRDRPGTVNALERLALLGNEGAMLELSKHLSSASWRALVLRWDGPISPSVLRSKLHCLSRDERLRELLVLFVDNLDMVSQLGAPEARAVLDAATRQRDGVQRITAALRERAHEGILPQVFGSLFVTMCLHHDHGHEVIRLYRGVPAYVGMSDLLEAHRIERQWEEIVALTASRPEFVFEHLQAQTRLALRHGGTISSETLGWCSTHLTPRHRTERLPTLLHEFEMVAPGQPVTRQLEQLVGAP